MIHLKTNHSNANASPRTSLYFPDGAGRDSYIFTNNGGLVKSGITIMKAGETQGNFSGVRLGSNM